MYINGLDFMRQVAQGMAMYLGIILATKYLFFEKGIVGKDQITFHLITIFGVVISSWYSVSSGIYTSMSEKYYILIVLIMSAVWIFIGRDENKVTGVLLSVPIMGIIDGLFVPFAIMPSVVLRLKGDLYNFVTTVSSIVFILIMVAISKFLAKKSAFFDPTKTKDIDNTIAVSDSTSRNLNKVEKGLLCFIGVFELIFSTYLGGNTPFQFDFWFSGFGISKYDYTVLLLGVSTFIMMVIVIIVVLVGNKRVYYTDKISDIQFNIIVMMAEIVENRDENTGGHIQRTAKYVEIIANYIKNSRNPYQKEVTDQFINDIKVAAPLHDIGKIHVSDLILNKPGKLDAEEFEIMKTHSDEGRKLLTNAKQHLGDFSYLDMAIDMAAYHHEWWDGGPKGYPDHLSGEDIPLSARMMAVADVFDALTARRCYKEPMPLKKAIKIIKEENGTHFDPVIVDAFLESIDEITEAFNQFESSMPKVQEQKTE